MKLFPTTIQQQQTFSLIVNFKSMSKDKLLIPMTISSTQLNCLRAYERAIEADYHPIYQF